MGFWWFDLAFLYLVSYLINASMISMTFLTVSKTRITMSGIYQGMWELFSMSLARLCNTNGIHIDKLVCSFVKKYCSPFLLRWRPVERTCVLPCSPFSKFYNLVSKLSKSTNALIENFGKGIVKKTSSFSIKDSWLLLLEVTRSSALKTFTVKNLSKRRLVYNPARELDLGLTGFVPKSGYICTYQTITIYRRCQIQKRPV